MTKDNINPEVIEDIQTKFNELLDLLTDMKLNPLADFESLKVEDNIDYSDDPEDEGEDDSEEEDDGTGF